MKNNLNQYKNEVVDVFQKIAKDRSLLREFLVDILTPHEFDEVSVRWQIVKRLGKGEHHQSIAEDLHVGVSTVTRGSREMRNKEGGFQKALKLIK